MLASAIRRLSYVVATAFLLAAVTALPVKADTIFSNFGPGMTFDTTTGYALGPAPGQVVAVGFIPKAEFKFTDARFAVGFVFGSVPFEAFLETDSGGMPGSIIDTLNLAGTIGNFPPGSVVTYDSSASPLLASGASYWLVLVETDPGTQVEWNLNSSGDLSASANFAFNESGDPTGPWSVAPPGFARTAFQVDGAPIGAPEPATLFLLGSAMAGIVFARRRSVAN